MYVCDALRDGILYCSECRRVVLCRYESESESYVRVYVRRADPCVLFAINEIITKSINV